MQGRGVEVVQADGGTYRLDVEALKRILLREQVKDLPVAVVSVAGAYRGGKSFLLNFFLRYIVAPHSSQLDGSWLGGEHAALEGFSWRGGSVRNTTGIVIWSEPIVATLHSGEKVAVILMDTQGTFDSVSTVRDCSTIFALSTLLSSIQIYNLSKNIGEDHLQHLQLFTEYGKLINDKDSKAFQSLEFLVRDWPNAVEYPYGAAGGSLYLKEKLLTTPNMNEELRDLREHIRASFELVSCFLMPHPGLEVIEPDFKGQTSKISSKFMKCIEELTSHIFGPASLKPKEISGERVTASTLFTYFETYVKLFNSDDVPTPTSVMQATAKAGLLSAFEEVRRRYENDMERDCGASRPSLPPHDLHDVHQKHAGRALAAFTDKKKMGSKSEADKYLRKLRQELENRLVQYSEVNHGKLQKTINDAIELYETKTEQMKRVKEMCVHPSDLAAVHHAALRAAVRLFDQSRRTIARREDKERLAFVKNFEKQYQVLQQINNQNNNIVVTELRFQYLQNMRCQCRNNSLSERQFTKAHKQALAAAVDGLHSKRIDHPGFHNQDTDEYKSKLIEIIADCFAEMRETTESKTRAAFNSSVSAYEEHMASAWDSKKVCLHPGDLDLENNAAQRKALAKFRLEKDSGEVYFHVNSYDEDTLAEVFKERFEEIKNKNEVANEAAVKAAVNLYNAEMTDKCAEFSPWWLLYGFGYLLAKRDRYHSESKERALNLFLKARRRATSTANDVFMNNLQQKISTIKDAYRLW